MPSGIYDRKPRKPMILEKVLKRFAEAHGTKYDYSQVIETWVTEKVTIICPEHGPFLQAINIHYSGHGCPTCGSITANSKQNRDDGRYKKIHAKRRASSNYTSAAKKMVVTKSKIGPDGLTINERAAIKRAVTMIERGEHVDPSELREFESYRRRVRSESRKSLRRFPSLIGEKKSHQSLDHVFSIFDGFKNSVPESVVGHITNLRYMDGKANKSKNKRSDVTIDELFSRFENFDLVGVLDQE